MKRVVITGAGGFVGGRLARRYQDQWAITPLDHKQLELTRPEKVHEALTAAAPELVIHTAALADTGYCESHPLESFEVNLQVPVTLARECAALGAKLVLFSSDQVYNGTRWRGPLSEDAPLDPVNVYGRHKWEAEQRVLELCPDAVCLRASWMYDFERPGLKNSTGFWGMLRRSAAGRMPLTVPVREYRGITWVAPVVEAMERMADLPGGVYNMGARNRRNTFDTARECLRRMGAPEPVLELVQPDGERFLEFERNLSMDTTRLKAGCGVDFGDTADSFSACLAAWEQEQQQGGKQR